MSENCTDTTQKRSNASISAEKSGSSGVSTQSDVNDELGGTSFDHLYACNSENGELTFEPSAESEVSFHRDWLTFHLDLIQQQSDELLSKEKTILLLKQENEMLKLRLRSIDHSVTFQETEYISPPKQIVETQLPEPKEKEPEMTQDSMPCEDDTKTNIKILELNCEATSSLPTATIVRETNEHFSVKSLNTSRSNRSKTTKNGNVIKVRKDLHTKLAPLPDSTTNNTGKMVPETNSIDAIPAPQLTPEVNHNTSSNTLDVNSSTKSLRSRNSRKRLSSSCSLLSNTDSVTEEKDLSISVVKKKLRKSVNDELILTCSQPYVIQSGDPCVDLILEETDEVDPLDRQQQNIALEVPKWRVKVYTSCYQMEGTENLDDDVFNRRHTRLENDERRRKRWDVQRIREQKLIEKLKQRQERIDSGSKSEDSPELPGSLWPALEDIQSIEVTESLPVSAFGCPIPRFTPSDFSLPWLNHNATVKKPATTSKKSNTAKRKSSTKR